MFPLAACICLITMALEFEGNFWIFLVVNSGNIGRYPTFIAFLRVVMVDENSDAW